MTRLGLAVSLLAFTACNQGGMVVGLEQSRKMITVSLDQDADVFTDDNNWGGVMYEEVPANNAGDYSFNVVAMRVDTGAHARWNVDGGVKRIGTGNAVLVPTQPLNVVPIYKDLGMTLADFRVRVEDTHITAEIKGLDGVDTRWKVTRGSLLTYDYNP